MSCAAETHAHINAHNRMWNDIFHFCFGAVFCFVARLECVSVCIFHAYIIFGSFPFLNVT